MPVPDGGTAVYRCEQVGNVVGIDRYESDDPSVVAVVSQRAAIGDEVVVHGTGFPDVDPTNPNWTP